MLVKLAPDLMQSGSGLVWQRPKGLGHRKPLGVRSIPRDIAPNLKSGFVSGRGGLQNSAVSGPGLEKKLFS